MAFKKYSIIWLVSPLMIWWASSYFYNNNTAYRFRLYPISFKIFNRFSFNYKHKWIRGWHLMLMYWNRDFRNVITPLGQRWRHRASKATEVLLLLPQLLTRGTTFWGTALHFSRRRLMASIDTLRSLSGLKIPVLSALIIIFFSLWWWRGGEVNLGCCRGAFADWCLWV